VAANLVLPMHGANSAPINPLAGFEEPLRGGERERKGEEKEGTGENTT